MTESEILDGCRRGDRQAQRELYLRTSNRIHRLLLRMIRDSEAALDLAQATYLKAFTRIGQFDGRSAVATWIYRIAVTEALQYFRRQGRDVDAADSLDIVDPAPDSARVADVRMDIEDALGMLDPVDRTILLLRYDEGHDYRAMAEILECAEGTIASRLHRARQRLRLALKNGYCLEEDAPAAHQMR